MNRREFGVTLAAGLISSRAARQSLGSAARESAVVPPKVNGERLNRHLTEISRFGANPQGGVTRLAYSDSDRQGREYVLGLMRDAKLVPTIDTAGNIIAAR